MNNCQFVSALKYAMFFYDIQRIQKALFTPLMSTLKKLG